MRRLLPSLMLLGVMLACAQVSRAAQLKDVISGRSYPLTLQLKDLDGEWRRLTTGGAGESGALGLVYSLLRGGGGGGMYYTKGEVVAVGTDRYLVAYSRRVKPGSLMGAMMSGPEGIQPEELTPESPLSLSLLNLRTAGSLVDIRAFNLEEELAAAQELAAASEEVEEGPANVQSLTNLKNLALAVQMYLADHDDMMPDLSDPLAAMDELTDYVRDESVFYHPETGEPYAANAALSGRWLGDMEDFPATAVFYEELPAEDGTRGVAFLDGHAARVREADWRGIREVSEIPAPEAEEVFGD